MSDGPYQGHQEAEESSKRSAILVEALALYLLQYAGPEGAETAEPIAQELRSIRDNILSMQALTFTEDMGRQAERITKSLHSEQDNETVAAALSDESESEWLRHSGAWCSFAYELFKEDLFRRNRLMEIFLEAHLNDRIIGFGRCEGESGEKLRMITMDERIGNHLIPEVSILTKDPVNHQTSQPYRFFLVLTDMTAYRFDEMQWED